MVLFKQLLWGPDKYIYIANYPYKNMNVLYKLGIAVIEKAEFLL